MILRRIRELLTLLAAGAMLACAPDAGAPQTQAPQGSPRVETASAPRTGAPGLPPDLAQRLGVQIYRDPALQAYVERVGQRLVSRGGGGDSRFRFYVLDVAGPNAYALPTGHVFVTRGLLAMLDDEAELAAALAHEMGHVTRRHAAQREQQRRTAIETALEAARASGSSNVGNAVMREGLLALRRYSREHEIEADRAGQAYLHQAGYRGDAMASLIEKLRRQSRFEAALFGRTPEAAERPSALSTHPPGDERLVALQGLDGAGESGRDAYLAAIDGLMFDDPPEEGFVRGTRFVHPVLKLAFQAPRDFRLYNDHDGVIGTGPDRSVMFFSCRRADIKGRLVDWMREEIKPTPSDVQPTDIGGAEAAIGERPRGADTQLAAFKQVFIRRDDGVCWFNMLSDGPANDRRMLEMLAMARSFRRLSDAEAAAARPYRLRVVPLAGTSPERLAQRVPYGDFRLERLLALNGVDSAAALATRRMVKIIEAP